MNLTNRHRRMARAIWESGGRLDEVSQRERIRPQTLRRWLADPAFRTLLAEESLEPLLQATHAVMRWAPAAVARLIRDLDSESSSDARQAAREILRLAMDAPRQLSKVEPAPATDHAPTETDGPAPEDPLARRVAGLSDENLERIFAILNADEPAADKASDKGDPA